MVGVVNSKLCDLRFVLNFGVIFEFHSTVYRQNTASYLRCRFHAIYWPAFLMAAGIEPPRKILCHSHWLMNKEKVNCYRKSVSMLEAISFDCRVK